MEREVVVLEDGVHGHLGTGVGGGRHGGAAVEDDRVGHDRAGRRGVGPHHLVVGAGSLEEGRALAGLVLLGFVGILREIRTSWGASLTLCPWEWPEMVERR